MSCIFGTLGYTLNEAILEKLNEEILKEGNFYDSGGSLMVNCFGAYFGLTIGMIIFCREQLKTKLEEDYIKVFFTTIGSLILWIYWPLFNSSFAYYS